MHMMLTLCGMRPFTASMALNSAINRLGGTSGWILSFFLADHAEKQDASLWAFFWGWLWGSGTECLLSAAGQSRPPPPAHANTTSAQWLRNHQLPIKHHRRDLGADAPERIATTSLQMLCPPFSKFVDEVHCGNRG